MLLHSKQRGDVKIFDFGLARSLPTSSKPDDTYHLSGMVGSLRYMAPEVANGQPYNLKCDVYSLSVLLWEVLALTKPYAKDSEPKKFIKKVIQGGTRPKIQPEWPATVKTLLAKGWTPNVEARYTMREVNEALATELGRRSLTRDPSAYSRRRSTFVFRKK